MVSLCKEMVYLPEATSGMFEAVLALYKVLLVLHLLNSSCEAVPIYLANATGRFFCAAK
jgi:hypothetical protein